MAWAALYNLYVGADTTSSPTTRARHSRRRITVSTSGVVQARHRATRPRLLLAISLHAQTTAAREAGAADKSIRCAQVMAGIPPNGPVNAKRVTFEYVMLKGATTARRGQGDCQLLKGIPAKINLIR